MVRNVVFILLVICSLALSSCFHKSGGSDEKDNSSVIIQANIPDYTLNSGDVYKFKISLQPSNPIKIGVHLQQKVTINSTLINGSCDDTIKFSTSEEGKYQNDLLTQATMSPKYIYMQVSEKTKGCTYTIKIDSDLNDISTERSVVKYIINDQGHIKQIDNIPSDTTKIKYPIKIEGTDVEGIAEFNKDSFLGSHKIN